MQSLPNALKLYLTLAIERREILARHMALRIAFGVAAAMVLLVGLALLNVALFVALRPLFGDLWAVVTVAMLHFVAGGAFALYALTEPSSAAMRALAEAEAAALASLDSEAQDALDAISRAHHQVEAIGSGLLTTANLLPALSGLLKPPRPVPPAGQPSVETAAKPPGDKT